MRAVTRNKYDVIAQFDRAIQYVAAVVIHTTAGVYWMPRLRGA
jgi:hypothetical protein